MNDNELIIAIIVGLVVFALIIKLWRVLLGLGFVAVVIIGVLCVSGKFDCPIDIEPRGEGGGGSGSFGPSNIDIIRAVYTHLRGKTYLVSQSVPSNRPPVPCTLEECKQDDRDPYLGKCRGFGGLGCGFKHVPQYETKPVPQFCPDPPLVTSTVWHVQKGGASKWIVSNPWGHWTVEQVGSGFRVTAHQQC